jgi:hypothetical protein
MRLNGEEDSTDNKRMTEGSHKKKRLEGLKFTLE